MNSPDIQIASVKNVYTRQMRFVRVGDTEQGHVHQFDHLTLLASGSLRVSVDGLTTDYKAPHMIWIHKDVMHELTALENNTVAFCIHAHRDLDGEIISPEMVPNGVTHIAKH